MADIRFMEAKGGGVSARVNVNLLNSTFLPQSMFKSYNLEEIVKGLIASAKTENERKDYSCFGAILKWGKTCHGTVKNITMEMIRIINMYRLNLYFTILIF